MRVFGTWYGPQYDRLAQVWAESVRTSCPGAEVIGKRSKPGGDSMRIYRKCGNHVCGNTHKLGLWLEATKEAVRAGESLVLMDVDTIVLRDLSESFDQFTGDVAYTIRDYKIEFNAGVIFLRPTSGAIRFMEAWASINSAIVSAAKNRRQATAEGRGSGFNYGGANQHAMSRLLRKLPEGVKVDTLPCEVWNSVDQTWGDFGPHTGVVHLKGTLRDRVLNDGDSGDPDGTTLDRIVATYRGIEAGVTQPQEVAA